MLDPDDRQDREPGVSVCLLVIDDGREDYLADTLAALSGRADAEVVIRDDEHHLGFCGAIQEGWDQALDTGCQYVFHVESDFTFNHEPPVNEMVALLERQKQIAQVALKRQPWNDREKAAGGIVEADPDDFMECSDELATWTEHRKFWTTNPSVYSTRFCQMGWPQERNSEGIFTHRLLVDPLLKFAFWGGKFDAPLVTHHGQRAGVRY